jgi:hypothetical protein
MECRPPDLSRVGPGANAVLANCQLWPPMPGNSWVTMPARSAAAANRRAMPRLRGSSVPAANHAVRPE